MAWRLFGEGLGQWFIALWPIINFSNKTVSEHKPAQPQRALLWNCISPYNSVIQSPELLNTIYFLFHLGSSGRLHHQIYMFQSLFSGEWIDITYKTCTFMSSNVLFSRSCSDSKALRKNFFGHKSADACEWPNTALSPPGGVPAHVPGSLWRAAEDLRSAGGGRLRQGDAGQPAHSCPRRLPGGRQAAVHRQDGGKPALRQPG